MFLCSSVYCHNQGFASFYDAKI
ncbi:CxxxxCH/CxxCH domain-containing protein [uncultured Prevotella sp.]